MEERELNQTQDIPEVLPILPLRETVVYPQMLIPLIVGREKSIRLVEDALSGNKLIGMCMQKTPVEDPTPDDIYRIGTVGIIVRSLRFPDNTLRLFVQGLQRIRVIEFLETEPYFKAKVEVIEEKVEKTVEIEGMMRNLLNLFQKMASLIPQFPEELLINAMNIQEPGRLADFIAFNTNLNINEKQEILETIDVKERLQKVTYYLTRELEILEIANKIQNEVKNEIEKSQKEYFLRQQMKAIQKELGEIDPREMEINELRQKLQEAKLPPEAMKEAERELERLSLMPPGSAEYTVTRTYLDWLISLPWAISTEDNLDIKRAEEILNEDHYDLEKVKERILEYLAVRKLKSDMKGPILCFVGPPGVGKTSLGKSIARALGRKFVRISLGGIRDEAEIRGHRRTYVGALPGRIIQGIRKAESNNPVFMLDEIDKLGSDFRGDPAAALLEVLDPEQNNAFVDNYLGVPFDLSKVMFIATANVLYTIPPALLDRMEVIELPGYTEYQKMGIAKGFLIPRQLKEHGLEKEQIEFSDDAIRKIIREYTREAGVRNLEREIASIIRKVAKGIAEGSITEKVIVKVEDVPKYLGPEKYTYGMKGEKDEVGVATGLAWTEAGGDILFVEALVVEGKGNLILTGKLGEVMQESAKTALSYVRSKLKDLNVSYELLEKADIHVHVPSGAIPKDGPSAGVTIATAIASALTRRPVKKDIGMTGEITLRGKVLPVGGIREKVLAAHRAGLTAVIMPKENKKDLEEIPEEVKKEITFYFVEHADEVLNLALLEVKESAEQRNPERIG
ncbi:endopeptidase La [Dictyoglomus thermophilum]|uniref:Lon protease n=1 Tax=Dictyoglomus thermophilum (strain ATCC 35947 / DSM 3960 / H-6-12) TaxID=309799 RepID=LON_DICT6|nr:endopeptidase La [Dictyoglomus thermophilum]B5YFG2.1 RecName: Full=Lon protease; AltName: Full=ATP-dependent protease La [Dictyoglomus thermophilum H-6-12]ACI18312.1 ATP-dependent protease La [Dictyoglomus thermophilum H-6-12]